jgi:hypothetical protein
MAATAATIYHAGEHATRECQREGPRVPVMLAPSLAALEANGPSEVVERPSPRAAECLSWTRQARPPDANGRW